MIEVAKFLQETDELSCGCFEKELAINAVRELLAQSSLRVIESLRRQNIALFQILEK